MAVYDINGNIIDSGGGGSASKDTRSILHQGWHDSTVNGNSKSAFVHAYTRGFTWVEADINVTSDSYLVMSHDSTASVTYAQWKTDSEHISFDEFLQIVKKTNLMVYLDGKSGAQDHLQTIYDKIMGMDLLGNFVFIGTVSNMVNLDSRAKKAYDIGNLGTDLSGYDNKYPLYCNYVNVTAEEAQNAIDNGFILQLYTISTTGNFLTCFNNLPQATMWCVDSFSVDALLAANL